MNDNQVNWLRQEQKSYINQQKTKCIFQIGFERHATIVLGFDRQIPPTLLLGKNYDVRVHLSEIHSLGFIVDDSLARIGSELVVGSLRDLAMEVRYRRKDANQKDHRPKIKKPAPESSGAGLPR